MSEFACSICNYSSNQKQHIKKHISNKIKCGDGLPEILEIPVDINCEFCLKEFTTRPSMKRHLKTCKVKKTNLEEELSKKDQKIRELETKLAQKPTTIINDNSTTNNTVNIIIQLRPYNDPKLPDDIDDIYEDAWSKLKSIPLFVERLHLNNDLPENNNICITNLKTKLGKVFTEQGWTTRDQDKLLDQIITQSNYLLDKWVRAKKNRKEKYQNDFIKYLEEIGRKRFDEETRQELKLMLYDAYKNGLVNPKSRTKQYVPVEDDSILDTND